MRHNRIVRLNNEITGASERTTVQSHNLNVVPRSSSVSTTMKTKTPPLTPEQIITEAKAYAEKNYSKGMDTFVECYTDEEWQRFILHNENTDKPGKPMTLPQVKSLMRTLASVWQEREANAEAERF